MGDAGREQCWIIATSVNPEREADDANRESILAHDHHAYIKQLDQDGHLVMHGASRDEHGVRHGTGFIVIRAATKAQAEAIALREPYIAAGVRLLNLIPWQVHRSHAPSEVQ
jgi:uncharacterized protein YciI